MSRALCSHEWPGIPMNKQHWFFCWISFTAYLYNHNSTVFPDRNSGRGKMTVQLSANICVHFYTWIWPWGVSFQGRNLTWFIFLCRGSSRNCQMLPTVTNGHPRELTEVEFRCIWEEIPTVFPRKRLLQYFFAKEISNFLSLLCLDSMETRDRGWIFLFLLSHLFEKANFN